MATITLSEDPKAATITLSDVGGTAGATPLTLTINPPHKWAATHDYQQELRDQYLSIMTWLYARLKLDTVIAGGDGSTIALVSGQTTFPTY